MSKPRIGFVGCGHNALGHMRAHLALGRSEVVAVCDPLPDRTERAAALTGAPLRFHDDTIYACDAIDAISIHTPDHLHAEPFERALAAGKHVLVEKPMANDLASLERMVVAARRHPDRVIMVAQVLRFLPHAQRCFELVRGGVIGEVVYMEGDYLHDLRVQGAPERFNPALGMNWYLEQEHPLVGGGCHPYDLMRWFAGVEAVEVTGFANRISFPEMRNESAQVALFHMASGAIAKCACLYSPIGEVPRHYNLHLYGTKGTIRIDEYCVEHQVGEKAAWKPLIDAPQHGHPYGPEIAHWLDGIEHGAPITCDAFDGANSAAAVLTAVEAIRAGRVLPVPHFAVRSGPLPSRTSSPA